MTTTQVLVVCGTSPDGKRHEFPRVGLAAAKRTAELLRECGYSDVSWHS